MDEDNHNMRIDNNSEDDNMTNDSITDNSNIDSMTDNMEKIFVEGIKEKIEELLDDDIFYRYGQLIGRGSADFNIEYLKNTVDLMKNVPSVKKSTKKTLEW